MSQFHPPPTTTTTTAPPKTAPSSEEQPPPMVVVPDVVGEQIEAATKTLQGAGFKVRRLPAAAAEPAGQVMAQSPPAGSRAPKGSTVSLEVAGPPPAP